MPARILALGAITLLCVLATGQSTKLTLLAFLCAVRRRADASHGVGDGRDLVVICGFGPVGQIVATLISSPAVSDAMSGLKFIAFDLNPKRVSESRAKGYPVYYGDGSQPKVRKTC